MKTYNIVPEGATHTYELVGGETGFYKLTDNKWFRWAKLSYSWRDVIDNTPCNTATPLNQLPLPTSGVLNGDQVNTLIEELSDNDKVDWKNKDVAYDPDGNEVTIISTDLIYCVDNTGTFHYYDSEDLYKTKPESPEDKAKRIREENGEAYYNLTIGIETDVMHPERHGKPNRWKELRDEWQEVYMRQAEVLGFNKVDFS